MNLIFETDIGRDPDDFFALCYLISAGVNIRCILLSPGDPDQVALTRFVLDEVGLDIPIGVGKINRDKRSVSGVHLEMMRRYDRPEVDDADRYGPWLVKETLEKYPDCEMFVIGPVTSIGTFFKSHPDTQVERATMQGGFLSYDLHDYPCVRLDKFEGKLSVPTFNLNGDKKASKHFLAANIQDRRFVSKNLCHTIVYDEKAHKNFIVKDRASEIFDEAMKFLLRMLLQI